MYVCICIYADQPLDLQVGLRVLAAVRAPPKGNSDLRHGPKRDSINKRASTAGGVPNRWRPPSPPRQISLGSCRLLGQAIRNLPCNPQARLPGGYLLSPIRMYEPRSNLIGDYIGVIQAPCYRATGFIQGVLTGAHMARPYNKADFGRGKVCET